MLPPLQSTLRDPLGATTAMANAAASSTHNTTQHTQASLVHLSAGHWHLRRNQRVVLEYRASAQVDAQRARVVSLSLAGSRLNSGGWSKSAQDCTPPIITLCLCNLAPITTCNSTESLGLGSTHAQPCAPWARVYLVRDIERVSLSACLSLSLSLSLLLLFSTAFLCHRDRSFCNLRQSISR